ncbi:DUF134 domain-containing protein [Desulfoscipio geothermicus]|uniref:UPF0251 protein SAMN05660706_11096 n=1 Tax=Desulfoscipio geothermicus DSM 3669 TaxID=1121426 RepID=A0A1I6DGL4_9FIRM|nr:DUF134 domain-containing protein [Desulfoscipio geothermicus]SFR04547.1 Predicted DNA-binding protein, UPF0251 family [Desulfoscipio geothermicus DSM 3669]
MSRPPKCRRVEFIPELTYFKPAGIPVSELEEVQLTVEELEAIRLKDLLGLEQEGCAEKMGVSRPTYHRILSSARSKVAMALVEGKAIRVEGGHFEVVVRRFKCMGCGHQWELPCGMGPRGHEMTCPECRGGEVFRINKEGRPMGCRWQNKNRRQES